MKGAIAGEDVIRLGQEYREFILIVGVLIAYFVAVVEEMPPVATLHEGQLLERSCRIIPDKQEIDPRAVMNRTYFDRRVATSVEIPAPLGVHRSRRFGVGTDELPRVPDY